MEHRKQFPEFDEAANVEMDRVYDIKGDTWTNNIMEVHSAVDNFLEFKMEQAITDYIQNGTPRALLKIRNYAAMLWTRQQIRDEEWYGK